MGVRVGGSGLYALARFWFSVIISRMKNVLFHRGISAVCAGILCASSAPAWGKSAKEVFAEVARSVVVVLALDSNGETSSQGSGVVVGNSQVATNCHVIEDAVKIGVRQALESDIGQSYRMDAAILARDDERDLCLLFVGELSEPPAAPIVKMGAAKALSIGEEIFAIGAPKGLDLSLSRGIVSQLRKLGDRQTAPFVQTDAAISPGSSGGGLFNDEGLLVGITTFKRVGGENLNFAIPAEWVGDLLEQGRKELVTQEKVRECPDNPDYECVIDLALSAVPNIDGAGWRAWALRDIALAQAEAGYIDSALETAQSIDDRGPRNVALRDIASTQARAGDIDGALDIARSIEKFSNPRTGALRDIVSAQAKAGDIDGAFETARSIDYTSRGSALRDIVSAQAKTGDIDGAFETARNIDDADDRAVALGNIALAQAQAGNTQPAQNTFADALVDTQSIDHAGARAWALRSIASAQVKAGNIQSAQNTFADAINAAQSINAANRAATALRGIALAQVKAGDIDGAFDTARSINLWGYRISALLKIASETGDTQLEQNTLTDALSTARNIDDADRRAWALRFIASAQAEMGNFQNAIKTAMSIGEIDDRVKALAAIAKYLAAQERN